MREFYGAIVAAYLIGTPAHAIDEHISLASYCLGYTLEFLHAQRDESTRQEIERLIKDLESDEFSVS
jgi:hypothetical protein